MFDLSRNSFCPAVAAPDRRGGLKEEEEREHCRGARETIADWDDEACTLRDRVGLVAGREPPTPTTTI